MSWFADLLGPWRGFTVTFRQMFKPKVTMQYPEEKWDDQLPDYYRGAPTLVTDEHGRERCVSCQLCEFICPPRAITIVPEKTGFAVGDVAPGTSPISSGLSAFIFNVCPPPATSCSSSFASSSGTMPRAMGEAT